MVNITDGLYPGDKVPGTDCQVPGCNGRAVAVDGVYRVCEKHRPKRNPENWTEEEWDKVYNSIIWCEVCGDGIGKQNYSEHIAGHKKRDLQIR